jgi:hypothetical protein
MLYKITFSQKGNRSKLRNNSKLKKSYTKKQHMFHVYIFTSLRWVNWGGETGNLFLFQVPEPTKLLVGHQT